ncbi:MAG: phosphatase PAP2 family protein [Flavobacteriaceae bacterium]|nr:phosphatase PAP2 family protein [Flavobacteriaceae bacterium]
MNIYIQKLIKDNKLFFYLYLLFLTVGGIFLIIYTKEDAFFIVNRNYSPLFDIFFKYITHLGDGILFAILILIIALFSYRKSLLGLIIFLGSALIAQLLKHTFFDHMMRPVGHFTENIDIHFVEGVTRHARNSFPSGHTTSVFALALFLVLAFKLRKFGWMLIIIAITTGYSRIYLAVHFPVDVYFGSLIGIVTALLVFTLLEKPFKNKFKNKGLLVKK